MKIHESIPVKVAFVACAIGFLVTFLSLVLPREDSRGIEEWLGLDLLYFMRGTVEPEANVIVVALSNEGTERLGLGRTIEEKRNLTGWPRSRHAELLRILHDLGVGVVAFDVFFRAPAEDPAEDEALAGAVSDFSDVLLLGNFNRDSDFSDDYGSPGSYRLDKDRLERPIELLGSAARGSVPFILPTRPHQINQYWTFVDNANDSPSLPVAAFALYAESAQQDLLRHLNSTLPAGTVDTHAGDFDQQMIDVRLAAERQPDAFGGFDTEGNSTAHTLLDLYTGPDSRYLNYYGPPFSIRTVRADDILLDGPDPDIPWRDSIVFVGLSERAPADQDDSFESYYSAASGLRLSGVEIAATALSNMIEGRMLRPVPVWAYLAVALIIGALLGAGFGIQSTRGALVCTFLVLAGYVAIAQVAFSQANIWMPIVIPLLVQGPVALIVGLQLRHASAEARRIAVTHGTSRYLPSDLVERISRNPEAATRASEIVTGVCMVTDIEQYTAFAENLPPRELESELNAYYDQLFEIVAEHGGLVTDIVGDSMVAVWDEAQGGRSAYTAPLAAALAISERLSGNATRFSRTRIGLQPGEFVLGTVGAREHLEYRAVGDTVNTAARIQVLNKQLGTLALATTGVFTGESVAYRNLGRFRLTGKQQILEIGEPVAPAAEATAPQRELIQRFERALHFFREQQFEQALVHFEALLADFAGDGPARFYVGHIRQLMIDPGSADPHGAISITH